MARPLRLEFPGALYHLTSRGNARQKVFFSDADREFLLGRRKGDKGEKGTGYFSVEDSTWSVLEALGAKNT